MQAATIAPRNVLAPPCAILRGIVESDFPLIWSWLRQYPKANFDDYGPRTIEEFHEEIGQRMKSREIVAIAVLEGQPVGIMGFRANSPRSGQLRGICFDRKVHGTGVAANAVSQFLAALFSAKLLDKISAYYFKDNEVIKHFLRKQGFQHEGHLRRETARGGIVVDVSLVALHRAEFEKCLKGMVN